MTMILDFRARWVLQKSLSLDKHGVAPKAEYVPISTTLMDYHESQNYEGGCAYPPA